MDFYQLKVKRTKEGVYIYPDFIVQSSKDLLIKGGGFHGLWDEEAGLWSTDEMDVARIIDRELKAMATDQDAIPLLMSSYESKSWTQYKNYVSSLEDSTVDLDLNLTFADDVPDRKKYASKRLPYSLVEGDCPAWEEIVGQLYAPLERAKIEWAIGSILSGESKKNQKFLVFYGDPGSGKGTILNIVEWLFAGYFIPIDMKAIGTSSNQFALAGFKYNPLVAIQQDGDLSRIEDNTRLNSLVSHELMPINEKFRSEFYTRAYAMLMLGTNEPVKITGSKSGIIRRLIDVSPSGHLIPNDRYHVLMNQVQFELGQIANHCLAVYYKMGKHFYSNYKPTNMMYQTDVFYNYIEANYEFFYLNDGVILEKAWQLYKEFCDDALVTKKLQRHQFRAELSSYFENFEERASIDGQRVRNYFSGFKTGRFIKADETVALSLTLDEETSLLDELYADQPAQYAKEDGTPQKYWTDEERPMPNGKMERPKPSSVVSTTLKDLDTSLLHYVKIPEKYIVIDFDLKDENGNKSRERNLAEAAEWPPTYAEYSQGGGGVHLTYLYEGPGEVGDLDPNHSDGIEVKSLTGNASLRRRFSRSNGHPVATITSGLKLKEKPLHDAKAMSSEKALRELIIRNLQKEIHPGTKPSVEFIKHILDEAYEKQMPYDVSDLQADVFSFAMSSSNHARYCMKLVQDMKFMSEEMALELAANDERLAFYDVEVFPNLFVICWKFAGEANIVRMINPSPAECDELLKLKLVGFNCRRYDNHILYARALGMSIADLYDISQRIINNDRSAMFGAAYDLSYVDIYDYSSKKQGLKKFEIELGIHHMELGLPWDEDVPEDKWDLVAEYCENDVVATEATHESRAADFKARLMLAKLSDKPVNASTQQHAAKIIFGEDKKPQPKFIYTDLSDKLFPGYTFDYGKSTYREEEVGEGGYVYAEPGTYKNVALLDVASMHPSSIELLEAFGPYTEKFSELKAARIAIKRGNIDEARRMLDGQLAPFLDDEDDAEALSYALKIIINIVYGLTSARFENPFKDPRNKDNIVAKRGALFMIDLKHAVQEQGFIVAHIKTDSIKIPDATPEIIDFVFEFGKRYGYEFEHEATYEEFVLFNDAVYIAKYGPDHKKAGKWEAVGAQFQHPYVYKTLLSGEEITFNDLCETKNVVKGQIFVVSESERRFVGRIGSFIPVLEGAGGGTLMRVNEVEVTDKETGAITKEMKDYAVTGTKGHLWLEAELVQKAKYEDLIDYTYFDNLVDKARGNLRDVGYADFDLYNE